MFKLNKLTNSFWVLQYLSYISRVVMSSSNTSGIPSGNIYAGMFSTAFVTTPSEDVAKTIAKGLIEQRLAACVNIMPKITSIYEWEGKVCEDQEALLMIKTQTDKIDALSEYVRKNHPYTVAEVISLPIRNGNHPYLKWIGETMAQSRIPGNNAENEKRNDAIPGVNS